MERMEVGKGKERDVRIYPFPPATLILGSKENIKRALEKLKEKGFKEMNEEDSPSLDLEEMLGSMLLAMVLTDKIESKASPILSPIGDLVLSFSAYLLGETEETRVDRRLFEDASELSILTLSMLKALSISSLILGRHAQQTIEIRSKITDMADLLERVAKATMEEGKLITFKDVMDGLGLTNESESLEPLEVEKKGIRPHELSGIFNLFEKEVVPLVPIKLIVHLKGERGRKELAESIEEYMDRIKRLESLIKDMRTLSSRWLVIAIESEKQLIEENFMPNRIERLKAHINTLLGQS